MSTDLCQRIRTGIGGWTFPPWRGEFYPPGLPHSHELAYASRRLAAIEVNGTFYGTFQPATFARWRDQTPIGFMFTLKAHRLATHRRQLATAGDAVDRFVNSGIAKLGEKLGPIVWQLMPSTRFERADLEAFLKLLPRSVEGVALQHVLEPRHPSFACDEYLHLARRWRCATVHTDAERFPAIADPQTPLAYLRLMRSRTDEPLGYPPAELEGWAQGARAWASRSSHHRVFAFFISAAKERNPAAAMALARMIGASAQAC